ncbi:DUF63 family protein [Halorhabdus salina]|uniref:DUF63 family protein n=1 Tax=Halorhabdus salina TaxID=2750670 RepID=UPI0015EE9804|nr:DUF63 family protein [Halorhabdus salina]
MPLLPSGLVVPDLPYLLGLGLGGLLTTVFLVGIEPPVTKGHVIAFVPWIAVGGISHALYQLSVPPTVTSPPGLYPEWVAPLFSAPAVYVTVYVLIGGVWLVLVMIGALSGRIDRVGTYLGAVGTGVLLVFLGAIVWQGLGDALDFSPLWPIVGFIIAVPLSGITYALISLRWTTQAARAGLAGGSVVFAHAFDGVTTAIGADVLSVTERSPLPEAIMDFAASLPTAAYLGSGWLFVVVKLLVAGLVVVAVADMLDEHPVQGSLLLVFVAAVGLGPAANNFVIFTLG